MESNIFLKGTNLNFYTVIERLFILDLLNKEGTQLPKNVVLDVIYSLNFTDKALYKFINVSTKSKLHLTQFST